jgi:hypothetical protein
MSWSANACARPRLVSSDSSRLAWSASRARWRAFAFGWRHREDGHGQLADDFVTAPVT